MFSKKRDFIFKKAIEFRSKFGLSSNEPLDIEALISKLNVTVLYRPLSENFSGMAVKREEGSYMMINSAQTIARQNFSICHEIYHLFVQEDFFAEATLLTSRNKTEEKLADMFASEILMPLEALFSFVSDEEVSCSCVSLETVVRAEQYFKVSRSAMLYRLKGVGLVDQNTIVNEYSLNVKESARRMGYSTELYEKDNKHKFLSDYGNIAHELYSNDHISEGHYNSLMLDIGIDIMDDEF